MIGREQHSPGRCRRRKDLLSARGNGRFALPALLALALAGLAAGPQAATLLVPGDHATIQAAIEAAADNDVILISPGVYNENLLIDGKSVTLASQFFNDGDPSWIDQTVIDGLGGTFVINIGSTAGPQTTIVGLTLQGAADGLSGHARFRFLNNRVTGTSDGIDYENNSGGLVRSCVFEGNGDDGIDLDAAVDVVIEDTVIRNNNDDGIEIRLHDYTGPELKIVIRDNIIASNGEDGIQLIDDQFLSSRGFTIERNLFVDNAIAAIGMMCCQNTIEDLQGASVGERILIANNTFVGNAHGVAGGDNVVAINNIFVDTPGIAVKRVDGGSIVAHSLFFGNGTDTSEANLDAGTILSSDPLLDAFHRLFPGSPAIDAGTACFEWNSEIVLNLQGGEFFGLAPDLGAFEASLPVPLLSPGGIVLLLLLPVTAMLGLIRSRSGRESRPPPVR